MSRAEYSAARQLFEDALPLYRSVGELFGEACALIRRGQLAQLSESGAARADFDEALALLERDPEDLALPGGAPSMRPSSPRIPRSQQRNARRPARIGPGSSAWTWSIAFSTCPSFATGPTRQRRSTLSHGGTRWRSRRLTAIISRRAHRHRACRSAPRRLNPVENRLRDERVSRR